MKLFRAAPETSEQYWNTPTCFFGSVAPAPPADQWVNATCWPDGNFLPPSSLDVQGAAMNLSRKFVVLESLSAIALSSFIAPLFPAMVSSYQRIVYPCSRLCTRASR